MTKSEIETICELAGIPVNQVSFLPSIQYITIDKLENKFPSLNSFRFKINTTDELLECYKCSEYKGNIDKAWTEFKDYDVVNGKIYKYVTFAIGKPCVDLFDFSSIAVIGLKEAI